MKEQQQKLIDYIKTIQVKGCITGSCLLPDYHEKSDVDCFLYDSASFIKLYYTLRLNPMFTILDKLELWKASMIETKDFANNKHHTGVTTIKLVYNTCIDINIILKKNCDNIFSVLSSFDMDLISKGYDLESKQYLDLSGDSVNTKIVNYNKWNPAFQSTEIWSVSRILRQLERCFKYHKRGYNTDSVIRKYIELIDTLQEFQSIFSSENFNEKLKITQENTLVIKQLCQLWLTTHEITDEQLELLKTKVKEI
jgi:hypothetical protein